MQKIAEFIRNNDNFILIPHKNPDGDCLGSVTALLYGLRELGKTAYISLPTEPSERLSYLWDESMRTPIGFTPDVCITVDVAALYMIDSLKESVFDKASLTACIDHHGTNTGFADVNHIDSSAAACGELVYELLKDYLKVSMTKPVCESLYSAISSDTGCFRYSNTTKKTHLIAAELIDKGIDSAKIIRDLFETKKLESLKISVDLIENMEFFFDGKICIISADNKLLQKYNMNFDMIEEYASLPRSVEGVEVGAFLKIKSDNEVKISLRSNEYVDVSLVASALGGGGHKRASGITVNGDATKAKELLLNELKNYF